MRSVRHSSWFALALAGGLSALPQTAEGAEPLRLSEPRIAADSAIGIVQVADAFDDTDVFDLHLKLSFDHSTRSAAIHRETSIDQPGLATGGYIADTMNVAQYTETTERLIPEISIGMLPDLALTAKLPVILARTQALGLPDGGVSSLATMGIPGEQLFSVPFQSPTRSGIEYLSVALDLGLMNQFRNPNQPNWTVGVEGRFSISDPMHACNPGAPADQQQCAHPADRNRNGTADDFDASYGPLSGTSEGNFSGGRTPGVSRGTTAVEAHAYVSKRIGYIEPYSGVAALFEFGNKGSDFSMLDLEASLVNHPPLRGTLVFGLAVIPWEEPERHRKISLDFRARGTYVSEGQDYSELFDALGSSAGPSLRNPQFAEYMANTDTADAWNPSVIDTTSTQVHFTGLTDVQQHGDYDLSGSFTWQASEYVNFDLGAEWRVIQGHFITYDQACNPALVGGVDVAGPCKYPTNSDSAAPEWHATGKANPTYRRVINEPGHRYKVDTSFGFRAWVSARVMF